VLRILKRQKFFFFLNNIINLNKQLTIIFETKEKKYNKSIIIKVCVNKITTKLK